MMTHENLQASLPDFAAGALSEDRCLAVEEHVTACAECREWLETYRLLETALTPVADHPAAEELANCALFSELDVELDAHLATCASCSEEIEISRAAVAFARDEGDAEGTVGWSPRVSGRQLALAAAILLAVIGTPLLTNRLSTPAAGTENYELSGKNVSGVTTIVADSSITAAEMEILSGAEVTLEAGEVVTFGEGFSVGADASLSIEIRTKDSL